MADVTSWFPSGMDPDEITALLAAYPGDPHAAAADAWDDIAAKTMPAPVVTSVSTGAQSVSYASGNDPASLYTQRANWHRARSNVRSVQLGSNYALLADEYIDEYTDSLIIGGDLYDIDGNPLDQGTIETYESPPIGG